MDFLQTYYLVLNLLNLVYVGFVLVTQPRQGLVLLALTTAFVAPTAGRIFGWW